MTAKKRLPIDLFMLAAFLAAYKPFTTGLSLHEWLCVALATPVLVHMVINWDWAVRVARSFSRRLRPANRVNLAVDVALFLSTVTVMLSGFMVSRVIAETVGYTASQDPMWHSVHSLSADAAMAFAGLHTVLHWKWFARVTGVLPARTRRPAHTRPPAPAEVSWWTTVPERVRVEYSRSQQSQAPRRSGHRPR
jgi:hypothetical protein